MDNLRRLTPDTGTIESMDSTPPTGYRPPQAWAPPPGAGPSPPAAPDRDDNLAVIALVTGILGFFACAPVGIVAFVYGRRALAACAAGTASNPAMARWGHRLGIACLALLGLAALTTVFSMIFLVVLALSGAA